MHYSDINQTDAIFSAVKKKCVSHYCWYWQIIISLLLQYLYSSLLFWNLECCFSSSSFIDTTIIKFYQFILHCRYCHIRFHGLFQTPLVQSIRKTEMIRLHWRELKQRIVFLQKTWIIFKHWFQLWYTSVMVLHCTMSLSDSDRK